MNRKYMPDADKSTWTPMNEVAEYDRVCVCVRLIASHPYRTLLCIVDTPLLKKTIGTCNQDDAA